MISESKYRADLGQITKLQVPQKKNAYTVNADHNVQHQERDNNSRTLIPNKSLSLGNSAELKHANETYM